MQTQRIKAQQTEHSSLTLPRRSNYHLTSKTYWPWLYGCRPSKTLVPNTALAKSEHPLTKRWLLLTRFQALEGANWNHWLSFGGVEPNPTCRTSSNMDVGSRTIYDEASGSRSTSDEAEIRLGKVGASHPTSKPEEDPTFEDWLRDLRTDPRSVTRPILL